MKKKLLMGWVNKKNKFVGVAVGLWFVRKLTQEEKVLVLYRRALKNAEGR